MENYKLFREDLFLTLGDKKINLSGKTCNSLSGFVYKQNLNNKPIKCLKDLEKFSSIDLIETKGLGKKSLYEILDFLKKIKVNIKIDPLHRRDKDFSEARESKRSSLYIPIVCNETIRELNNLRMEVGAEDIKTNSTTYIVEGRTKIKVDVEIKLCEVTNDRL